MTSNDLKQQIFRGRLQLTNKEIDEFFKQISGRSDIFWLLLNAEAKQAGCVISSDQAKSVLKEVIPKLTQGRADASQLINAIIENDRVTEDKIVGIFADLLGIVTYANSLMGDEDVTINEIRAAIAFGGETLDAEYLRISAADFVDEQSQPSDEQLDHHFEQYKGFLPEIVSNENPYGFGYKLPDRAKIEYLIIKLDDVRNLIAAPSQQEMEDFYRRNISLPQYQRLFKYTEPVDPNNPDSGEIEHTRTYAEASSQIKRTLIDEKTNSRADMILNEAIELVEADFDKINFETAGSSELKEYSGDYKKVATEIGEKYKIKVYTGQTGLLGSAELVNDKHLGTLSIQGQDGMGVNLAKVVLAIDELEGSTLGRFDVSKLKMWQNIGPMRDTYNLAIVRVIEAAKSCEPSDLNVTFSKTPAVLDETDSDGQAVLFSVREAVEADYKTVEAMKAAQSRAGELVKLIAEKGWDDAIAEYNKTYAHGQEVVLDKIRDLRLAEAMNFKYLETLAADNPILVGYIKDKFKEMVKANRLYSLLPPGETEGVNMMSVLAIEPESSYYVIKNILRKPTSEAEYYQNKSGFAYERNKLRSESLSVIHFLPDNIIKRMKFRNADEE